MVTVIPFVPSNSTGTIAGNRNYPNGTIEEPTTTTTTTTTTGAIAGSPHYRGTTTCKHLYYQTINLVLPIFSLSGCTSIVCDKTSIARYCARSLRADGAVLGVARYRGTQSPPDVLQDVLLALTRQTSAVHAHLAVVRRGAEMHNILHS